MQPLKIQKFIFNPFSENTYIVWDDSSSEGIVIDPGCSFDYEEEELVDFITKNQIKIKYLINTHCHLDHIFGNKFVKEKFNPVFLIPKKDLFLLNSGEKQAQTFGIELKSSPEPDIFIEDAKDILIGSYNLKFLFTPGHTPGEYCLYFPDVSLCFTGDVLFRYGIGRTDLWGGNYNQLIESIKEKLFTLEENVVIYPGHGEESTIGEEKKNNPFLNDIQDF